MSLASIITEIENAKAPSRWIDAKLDALFRVGTQKMRSQQGFGWAWDNFPVWAHHKHACGMCGLQHDNETLGMIWDSMEFTGSLDAALDLFKCALPGWTIASVGQDDRQGWHVELRQGFRTSYSTVSLAGAPTPAMAMCLAVLKGKQLTCTRDVLKDPVFWGGRT